MGTANLLHAAKSTWQDNYVDRLFYHVSTAEVYGSLSDPHEMFTESKAYDPRSPYSSSKAYSII